ncbi:MAG: hypothetical protein ACI97A_002135 [Planctomycetota bacterium]|jgi:hypothetical protein
MKSDMRELWLNSSVSNLKKAPAPQVMRTSASLVVVVTAAFRSVVDWFMVY